MLNINVKSITDTFCSNTFETTLGQCIIGYPLDSMVTEDTRWCMLKKQINF